MMVERLVNTISASLGGKDTVSFVGQSAGNDLVFALLHEVLSRKAQIDIKMWINIVGRPGYEDIPLYTDPAFLAHMKSLADRVLAVEGNTGEVMALNKYNEEILSVCMLSGATQTHFSP